MKDVSKIRTLLLYQGYDERSKLIYNNYKLILVNSGFDVESFCISYGENSSILKYSELNRKWESRDSVLLNLYDKLKTASFEKDVLILFNGANLHPEFLKELKTFNVYMCFDDPENSENLSKPVAKYFDACLVGNIASLNQYLAWGCKNVIFRPLGYFSIDVHSNLRDNFVNSNRDIDVSFFGERISDWRRERLNYLDENIQNFYARGKGWPMGYVTQEEKLSVYSRSKIGINIHNSTGPINLRTYTLPANGIMQICDNKYFLGHIFELGKEVVGFCEIEEVPQLVNFYLKNEKERNKIAFEGWKRAVSDYNEIAVWQKQMELISNCL